MRLFFSEKYKFSKIVIQKLHFWEGAIYLLNKIIKNAIHVC